MAEQVFCACGAVYIRTEEKVIFRDHDRFLCEVCKSPLETWSSDTIPRYRLVRDPRRIPQPLDAKKS